MSSCSTFIQPVRQLVALLWSPQMTRPSRQVPPRLLFIANPEIRGVARLHSLPAATLTGAVRAQAFIGQSPALTSRPKSAVASPNIAAALQVPRGHSLGLKLPVVEPFFWLFTMGRDLWRILVSRVCNCY